MEFTGNLNAKDKSVLLGTLDHPLHKGTSEE